MIMARSFTAYIVGVLIGFCYVQIKTTLKNKFEIDFWPTPQVLNRIVKQCQDRWGRDVPERRMVEDEDEDDLYS